MTLEELLADLPMVCDTGVKRDAKGHQEGGGGSVWCHRLGGLSD